LPILFVVACLFVGCRDESRPEGELVPSSQPAIPAVITLTEGGDMQPEPHSSLVQVYEDGTVRTRSGTKQLTPVELRDLLGKLDATGFFELTSESLVQQLREAGQFRQIIEGGRGRIALTVRRHDAVHCVAFSHPDAYADSSVESIKQFRKALHLVRDAGGLLRAN